MELNHKNYLITGASSGLGYSLVRRLLTVPDTKITAVARNIDTLKSLPKSRVFPMSFDLAKKDNIISMIDCATEQMGQIDCLISCAGFGYYEVFEDKDMGHIKRIFQTNVISPMFTLQQLLQKTTGKISFVTVSSAIGKFGLPGMALYCATKSALDGFQSAYQFEKPDRLHFMTVYPIGLKTPFWDRIGSDYPLPYPLQSPGAAAKSILKGLIRERKQMSSFAPAGIAWNVNRFLPVLVPAYQHWNNVRFQKWRTGQQEIALK